MRVVVLFLAALSVGLQAQSRLQPDPPKACARCPGWNAAQAPYRIFGNTYYVGPAGLSSILITSPTGLVLVDAALPESAPLIDANIRRLGFKPEDIRLILVSHTHYDHVGGVAAFQRLTGAAVAASPAAATSLAKGNVLPDDPQAGEGAAAMAFPPVKNIREVHDGEALTAGDITVTAHFTPGHTPGGTSWTWTSCGGTRCLAVAYVDSVTPVSSDGFRFTGDAGHASLVPSFEKTLATIAILPCDIVLSTHPSVTQMDAKRIALLKAPGTNPFIEEGGGGCRALAQSARADLDNRIKSEGGR